MKDEEIERKIPEEPQILGQVPKAEPESDPIGINAEGGVTTNDDGDEPGSPLEVQERESAPVVSTRQPEAPSAEQKPTTVEGDETE